MQEKYLMQLAFWLILRDSIWTIITFLPSFSKEYRTRAEMHLADIYIASFPVRFLDEQTLSFFLFASFFLLHLSLLEWEERERDVGPKNKSIILGRLVHLFPTLHNIPLGGLRTLFLLIPLSLFRFILFLSFFFTFALPVSPRDRRLKPISGKIYIYIYMCIGSKRFASPWYKSLTTAR